jgi:hypothetical protein
MTSDFIRVTRRRDGMWVVFREPRDLVLLTFRLKAHAVAYARAISLSGRLALFVDNESGSGILQSSSSLSNPIILDTRTSWRCASRFAACPERIQSGGE